MEYCIAVGSTDGKVVNEHFGRCRKYLIYKANDKTGEFGYQSMRDVVPACKGGEHLESDFDAVLKILSDCRVILISKIGPSAEIYLRSKGILALEYGGFIEQAIEKIIPYLKKQGAVNIKRD